MDRRVSIHDDEVLADESVVRRLLTAQRPDLAALDLAVLGEGTDNTMYRLGQELLLRLPRTPGTAAALGKELRWLPKLGPDLGVEVPEPVFEGTPSADFPLAWAIYRWIDGEPAWSENVSDWAAYGRDLAAVVAELHALPLNGERRGGQLDWYRGGLLQPHNEWVRECLDDIRALGADVDVDRLTDIWSEALTLPAPSTPHVWLHGDLKPSNVIVRSGRLAAIIDFGGLCVGFADAEHAPTWDLPLEARTAYRDRLGVDEEEWLRARAWALLVGASGVSYYWTTYPEFVAECTNRLQAVVADA